MTVNLDNLENVVRSYIIKASWSFLIPLLRLVLGRASMVGTTERLILLDTSREKSAILHMVQLRVRVYKRCFLVCFRSCKGMMHDNETGIRKLCRENQKRYLLNEGQNGQLALRLKATEIVALFRKKPQNTDRLSKVLKDTKVEYLLNQDARQRNCNFIKREYLKHHFLVCTCS